MNLEQVGFIFCQIFIVGEDCNAAKELYLGTDERELTKIENIFV